MPGITKTELLLEQAMADHAGDPERHAALERARRFKRSWIELAEILVRVREGELWQGWGHASFHDYCAKELHLKAMTVDKLCASYGFMAANAPRLVRGGRRHQSDGENRDDPYGEGDFPPAQGQAEEHQPVPSWQAVDYVARAHERAAADPETLAEMRRAVFEQGAPLPAISRKYREVAFPMAEDQRRLRLRTQILAVARRLAELARDPAAALSTPTRSQIEEACEAVVHELGAANEEKSAA